eukprot:gene50108-67103_t
MKLQYPGSPNSAKSRFHLRTALHSSGPVAWVRPATAPHARLTLTLPALLATRELALAITGAGKLATYQQARLAADETLPVSLVPNQHLTPIHTMTTNTPLHPTVEHVTRRITERSAATRAAYLAAMAAQRKTGTQRAGMGCANMAHTTAALPAADKLKIHAERAPHIGIVTAYNDMLSAHAPYQGYPDIIKQEARSLGATAQVAGGVPAMCDGVTQGTPGMELSLFSRDVIAMSTAVALTHDAFDAGVMLGVCDKIVPGLLMGALRFGHLPTILIPAGPMPTGLAQKE